MRKFVIVALCAFAITSCFVEEEAVVPCNTSASCPAEKPTCDPDIDGTGIRGCRGCTLEDDSECLDRTDGNTICDTSNGHCVQCLNDGQCSGETSQCDEERGVCVECTADDECNDPNAAKCEDNQCVACTEDANCDGAMGLGDNDNVCLSGVCKDCLPGTNAAESDYCGTKACNPADNSCRETDRGSVDVCGACVADTECGNADTPSDDYGCVELTFDEENQGGHCLKKQSAGTCTPPYTTLFIRESLSHPTQELQYCGINETLTTCEAVLELSGFPQNTCENDDDCAEGGLCKTIGLPPASHCTYECNMLNGNNECVPGADCDNGGSGIVTYCGG